MKTVFALLLVTLLVGLGACTVGEAGAEKRAVATLEAKSGSTVGGTATFTVAGASMVRLQLNVTGASPGRHGVHLHAVGDCSDPNAATAMGHWDPSMMTHGLPTGNPHHLGDCGNIDVGADGTGVLTITNTWNVGTGDMIDIVGKSIIVHANTDDGTNPMPAPMGPGNSGARQACGVIAMAQ